MTNAAPRRCRRRGLPAVLTAAALFGGLVGAVPASAGSGWTSLGGALGAGTGAVDFDGAQQDVVAFVTDADGHLWGKYQVLSTGSWYPSSADYYLINGSMTLGSAPVAVSPGEGVVDVFARGTDGQTYELVYDNGWGSSWIPLGGVTGYKPGVVVFNGQVDVFVTGTNGYLYEKYQNLSTGQWYPSATGFSLVSRSGTLTTGPTVAAPSASEVDVYGSGTSKAIYELFYADGRWAAGWRDLGGATTFAPSAVYVPTANQEDLFVTGTNGQVYLKYYDFNSRSWFPSSASFYEVKVPGTLGSGPSAVNPPGTDSVELFGMGTGSDNQLYETLYSPSCATTDSCSPQTFADAILQYPDIEAPVTGPNEYALQTWERAEGGGAGCPGQPAKAPPWTYSPGPAGNPMNTTQTEPGSTNWNSAGVQIFADVDGQPCWSWGVKANGDTLLNGYYPNIISVLQHPAGTDVGQCDDLANAVGNSPWGTGNFSADCPSAGSMRGTAERPVPASSAIPVDAQLYTNGAAGQPHYLLTITGRGTRLVVGLYFVYQDGRARRVWVGLSRSDAGYLTLRVDGQRVRLRYQAAKVCYPGCATRLRWLQQAEGCLFKAS